MKLAKSNELSIYIMVTGTNNEIKAKSKKKPITLIQNMTHASRYGKTGYENEHKKTDNVRHDINSHKAINWRVCQTQCYGRRSKFN